MVKHRRERIFISLIANDAELHFDMLSRSKCSNLCYGLPRCSF